MSQLLSLVPLIKFSLVELVSVSQAIHAILMGYAIKFNVYLVKYWIQLLVVAFLHALLIQTGIMQVSAVFLNVQAGMYMTSIIDHVSLLAKQIINGMDNNVFVLIIVN